MWRITAVSQSGNVRMGPTRLVNVRGEQRSDVRCHCLGRERPSGDKLLNHLLQSFDVLLREAHCLDHFLQSDLMRGVIELLLLQSAQISHRPALLAWIDATMIEQKGTYLLPMNP